MRKMIFPIITETEQKLPFYITSIGTNENQHPVQRPSGYPNHHFLYTTNGSGTLYIKKQKFEIKKNMGFFFQPGIPHEYLAAEEPWTTWWATFDGYAVKKLLDVSGLGIYNVFHITDLERLHYLHGEIYSSASPSRPAGNYDASHALYRFLLELRNCTGPDTANAKKGLHLQLQPLLKYIEDHYEEDISLNQLSEIAGVTPQHLCRIFKQYLNMRPFEYLTRFRLQRAKEILLGPGNPVLKEVAFGIGFHDVSYFCSLFKKYERLTPIEFKRMHKEL